MKDSKFSAEEFILESKKKFIHELSSRTGNVIQLDSFIERFEIELDSLLRQFNENISNIQENPERVEEIISEFARSVVSLEDGYIENSITEISEIFSNPNLRNIESFDFYYACAADNFDLINNIIRKYYESSNNLDYQLFYNNLSEHIRILFEEDWKIFDKITHIADVVRVRFPPENILLFHGFFQHVFNTVNNGDEVPYLPVINNDYSRPQEEVMLQGLVEVNNPASTLKWSLNS